MLSIAKYYDEEVEMRVTYVTKVYFNEDSGLTYVLFAYNIFANKKYQLSVKSDIHWKAQFLINEVDVIDSD